MTRSGGPGRKSWQFSMDTQVLLAILGMVCSISAGSETERTARQTRRPGDESRHATMTDWGLQHVVVPKNAVILDVGCGGGRTLLRLTAMAPEGKLFGLDYSAASVAVCEIRMREIERAVQIEQGSVEALPFPDRTFDIVTSRPLFYWPDLQATCEKSKSAKTGRNVL
jgi:SAM-dependent methyltransferase